MTNDNTKQADSFDPTREAARARIKIIDRADGGKEFILPAMRNFSEKRSFLVLWFFVTAFLAGLGYIIHAFPLPGVIGFFILNHVIYFWGFLGLFDLLLTIAVVDMWLRSSRIVARPGQLQTVTHWLFFRRAATISTDRILEIKIADNTSAGPITYYDIMVLTLGTKPGWIAKNFPAQRKPDTSRTENDIRSFNSGGKRLNVATGIKGKAEADWFADELCLALGLDTRTPSPAVNP
jgi:hypothetical protein